MADNRFDEFDEFPERSLTDNEFVNNYDNDEYSLTRDDEMPLTSSRSEYVSGFKDDEPCEDEKFDTRPRPVKPQGRRETIERIAEEQKSGVPLRPRGGFPGTRPDPRLAVHKGLHSNGPRPQGERKPAPARRTLPGTAGRAGTPARPQSIRKKHKSVFAAFYIFLSVIGVGVCLTLLFTVFLTFDNNGRENGEAGPFVSALRRIFFISSPPIAAHPDDNAAPSPFQRPDLRNQTALITAINAAGESRVVTLMNVSDRREQEFPVPGNVQVRNRMNMQMAFSELRVGHIVDIGYDARNSEILTIQESVQAWERRARTNVTVDIETATVSLGNDVFNFNSQTIVLHRGEPFPLSQIRPVDSVTMAGVGDTVWLVQLDAAHGFLQLSNHDMIENGTILIGTQFIFRLDDITEPITLSEGAHRILVEGSNIETLIENIFIEQGQTTNLNLGTAQFRSALLHVFVTPSDASIFVNGRPHDPSEGPAEVEFGEHVVRVERYGFMPQEQTFEITNTVASITFELVEIIVDSTIVIWTTPMNAEIFIDGVFIGFSTLTHTIAPGTYQITARLGGHSDRNYTITVPSGETVQRHLLLEAVIDDPLANQPPHIVDPPLPPGVLPPVGPGQPPEEPQLPTLPPSDPAFPYPPDDDDD